MMAANRKKKAEQAKKAGGDTGVAE